MDKIRSLQGLNLVSAYLESRPGITKTQAAREVGVDLSRLGQYRRGARPIPGYIQSLMRRVVLVYALGSAGRTLAEALDPPEPPP